MADGGDGGGERRAWSRGNWVLVLAFTLLTGAGVAVSTGALDLGVTEVAEEPGDGAVSVAVPFYVYLYASLGALGYVFTKLVNQLKRAEEWSGMRDMAEMGLRIPAAWVLAAGIYLLLRFLPGSETTSPQIAAGAAFLVGLYVNVAHKFLGSLADRLLGRPE